PPNLRKPSTNTTLADGVPLCQLTVRGVRQYLDDSKQTLRQEAFDTSTDGSAPVYGRLRWNGEQPFPGTGYLGLRTWSTPFTTAAGYRHYGALPAVGHNGQVDKDMFCWPQTEKLPAITIHIHTEVLYNIWWTYTAIHKLQP
ncbi:hypothetical protein BGZ73_000487, partial [Actinomortierella ambigua]